MLGLVLLAADVPLAHMGAVPALSLKYLAEKTQIGRWIIPSSLIPALACVEEESVIMRPRNLGFFRAIPVIEI